MEVDGVEVRCGSGRGVEDDVLGGVDGGVFVGNAAMVGAVAADDMVERKEGEVRELGGVEAEVHGVASGKGVEVAGVGGGDMATDAADRDGRVKGAYAVEKAPVVGY